MYLKQNYISCTESHKWFGFFKLNGIRKLKKIYIYSFCTLYIYLKNCPQVLILKNSYIHVLQLQKILKITKQYGNLFWSVFYSCYSKQTKMNSTELPIKTVPVHWSNKKNNVKKAQLYKVYKSFPMEWFSYQTTWHVK